MTNKEQSKDLGIKIGTTIEATWTPIKNDAEQRIRNSEIEIEINKAIIELATDKINKEKQKV